MRWFCDSNFPNKYIRNYTQDGPRTAINATRLTSQIPMHMKLVSVFLFNFQAEVLVSVRENFDFQPACLSEFEYETNVETGKLECFEIAS